MKILIAEILVVIAFIIGLVIYSCNTSVQRINAKCGTHYTASDYFWIGDNIRIMEKSQ